MSKTIWLLISIMNFKVRPIRGGVQLEGGALFCQTFPCSSAVLLEVALK